MSDTTTAAYAQGSLNRISFHMLLRVSVGCMGLAAEPLFVGNLMGGDASAAMVLLARTSGASGLVQFLFNPTFGTLSDSFGRKIFFMVGPLTNAIGNLCCALFPTNTALFAITRVLGKAMATLSGSTVCAAALSDLATGDALSSAFARLGSCASLGVVAGPLIGTAMLTRGMSVTSVYLAQAIAGFFHTAIVAILIRETLPREERRPFAGFKNPFSFLQLFTRGRKLRLMCLSCGFACFADGGNLNDIEQMWIANDVVDMGLNANSLYLSLWGILGSAGGLFVPVALPVLGKRGFATVTTFTNFLACMVWGLVPRAWAMFAGIFLHFPGINANASLPLKTQATEIAIASGLGRGEFAGYFGNLRALTVAVGPFLFGNMYAWGRTATPGRNLGYWAAALLGCVLPEVFHRMLSNADFEEEVKKP
jgi:DHA1 family tetracycline resistance protein-like MFS transporter